MRTQIQLYYEARKKTADLNIALMDMIQCKENPLTKADLVALIKRRPNTYGRFKHLLDSDIFNAEVKKRKPKAGYYKKGPDVWEVKALDDSDDLYMVCCGDYDEYKGKIPYQINVNNLPKLDDYDLSNVEY